MRDDTTGWEREDALSEVVGFVLLIAVIIAAFSIYMTYSIPVQGRDNEISHMDEVKDEFVAYKIGVDSLWTNGQTDNSISTTIKPGTSGATMQGSNGLLPVIQPVASSGTVAINQRTLPPLTEKLSIVSYSYVKNQSNRKSNPPLPITTSLVQQPYTNSPDSLLVNITVNSNIGATADPSRAINVSGMDTQGTVWQAWINITPRISYSINYTWSPHASCPSSPSAGPVVWLGDPAIADCLIPNNFNNYSGTDLSLSVIKNRTRTLSDFTIYKGINSSGTPYVVDLLDSAYGISSNIQNTPAIWYSKHDSYGDSDIAANATAIYSYQFQPDYTYSVPLGAVEYRANNYYWIPQTYYYQMGGVFLSQSDGVSPKLPPSVTFTYNKTIPGPIRVSIDAIALDQSNSVGIGGTTPVQIGTKVKSDSGDLPYAAITSNTMNVTITYTTPADDPNTVAMWKQFFHDAANTTGGIPEDNFKVDNTSNSAYIFIMGAYDPTKSGGLNADLPDISLQVKAVNITASILNIGGA